jgi:hypothetical protein
LMSFVMTSKKSSAIGLSLTIQSIKANDAFSKYRFTQACSVSAPTHRFLGPIRTVRMCLNSRNRLGGNHIQAHCGEETNVCGHGGAFGWSKDFW